jgi:hypothetical protein
MTGEPELPPLVLDAAWLEKGVGWVKIRSANLSLYSPY